MAASLGRQTGGQPPRGRQRDLVCGAAQGKGAGSQRRIPGRLSRRARRSGLRGEQGGTGGVRTVARTGARTQTIAVATWPRDGTVRTCPPVHGPAPKARGGGRRAHSGGRPTPRNWPERSSTWRHRTPSSPRAPCWTSTAPPIGEFDKRSGPDVDPMTTPLPGALGTSLVLPISSVASSSPPWPRWAAAVPCLSPGATAAGPQNGRLRGGGGRRRRL